MLICGRRCNTPLSKFKNIYIYIAYKDDFVEIDDNSSTQAFILDSRLSWNKHVQHVYISKGIGVIHRVK